MGWFPVMNPMQRALHAPRPWAACILLAVSVGWFLAPLPAAAAAEGADEAEVTFRAQGLPSPAQTSVDAVAQRAVVRQFLQEFPQYRIEPFNMPQVGVDAAMDSGPLMAISAGIPPHAIYVNFRQSATYIEQGFLEPLEVLLARLESDNPAVRQTDARDRWRADPTSAEIDAARERIRQRVPERVWPVIYRDDLSDRYEGKHVWAVPTGNLVRAMFFRRDLFHEAGLDPNNPPDTWDELLEAAQKLRRPERRQYGMVFSPGVNISWWIYNFITATGARAMERDEDGEWRAAFGTEGAAEAIYFIWRLIHEPFERDGEVIDGAAALRGDAGLLWDRGQVGIRFASLEAEMLTTIDPQLVGIAPVPRYKPGGDRGGELNARMLGVFSDSTPEQQLAVMRYIWHMTSEDAQRLRTRIFVDHGYGRFVNPDLLERFGYDRLLQRVPAGWRSAYEEAMEHGVPEPYGRNTQHIYRWMSGPINRALERDYHDVPQEDAIAQIYADVRRTAAEVDSRVLGQISEEEMSHRRMVGGFVLLLLFLAFAAGLTFIWRDFSKAAPPVDYRKQRRSIIWGAMLIAPGIGLVAMWQYLPLLLGGIGIAFMDYRVVLDNTWVGIDNFANILFDRGFWESLGREFYFVALMIGLGFWPPILLAILLQEVPTNAAKYVFRTVFYLPSVLIGVVVMFLWLQLYDPSPEGTLNQLLLSLNDLGPVAATGIKWVLLGCWLTLIGGLLWLPVKLTELHWAARVILAALGVIFLSLTLWPVFGALGTGGMGEMLGVLGSAVGRFEIEPLRWTQDPSLAMLCIVIPAVWASTGPICIIYLAGLKSVPNELYEAAAIDGASMWHRVFYIVLPRLKFLIVIQLIMALVAAFRGGEEMILIMTGGGPDEATTTLSLRIFYRTFMDLEFGLGTAMAWIMGGILIGFTAYQLRLLSRAEFRAAG